MSATASASNQPTIAPGTVVVVENGKGLLQQDLLDGRHRLTADEPHSVGGDDAGTQPLRTPADEPWSLYVDDATALCAPQAATAGVAVRLRHARIHAEDCAECETKTGFVDRIEREIVLEGPLDEGQRKRMLEIANLCPVHRTLTSEVSIITQLAPS